MRFISRCFMWYIKSMEISQEWIEKFKKEGFANVFTWHDAAGTIYEPHNHNGKVSIFVVTGSCMFDFSGEKRELGAGERFNIPVGAEHSAVVGPEGWNVVVGEEIEGDS